MPMGQWAISHMSYRTVFYMAFGNWPLAHWHMCLSGSSTRAAFRHQERLQCAFSSLVNLSFASRGGKQKKWAECRRNSPKMDFRDPETQFNFSHPFYHLGR